MDITVLIGSITLFVMSIFLGFELITKVPATLHTPLYEWGQRNLWNQYSWRSVRG